LKSQPEIFFCRATAMMLTVALAVSLVAAEVVNVEDETCESLRMLQHRANRTSEAVDPTGRPSTSVLCSETPACGALNLKGYCCPGASGLSLDCCFNQRHQQIRQCLQVGREVLESCPPHVDAMDMRPEDVVAVCKDECQEELLPLSMNCGVTNFVRTFEVLCKHPEETAAALRRVREEAECVNAKLQKSSTTCPPHLNIVRAILQSKAQKDVQILCSQECHGEMKEVLENCNAKSLSNRFQSLCSHHTQPHAKHKIIKHDEEHGEKTLDEEVEDLMTVFLS